MKSKADTYPCFITPTHLVIFRKAMCLTSGSDPYNETLFDGIYSSSMDKGKCHAMLIVFKVEFIALKLNITYFQRKVLRKHWP